MNKLANETLLGDKYVKIAFTANFVEGGTETRYSWDDPIDSNIHQQSGLKNQGKEYDC